MLLAKVIGVWAIIKGLAILIKKDQMNKMLNELMSNWTLLLIVAAIELIAGLFLVNTHNIWVKGWPVIITIIGWLMVIEGTAFMVLRKAVMKDFVRGMLNAKNWYVLGAIIALALGGYLVYVGYGFGA